MPGTAIALLVAVGWSVAGVAAPTAQRFEFVQTEMAVPIRIVLYATDNATAAQAAKSAYLRFHQLTAVMSDYDPQSELRRLCNTAGTGQPVRVSDDLWRVLVRSQELARQSDGAFDITVGPLVHLWRNARHTKELPSPESLAEARARVGDRFLRLDPRRHTVELLRPKMRLDLGGIGKGFAVDEALLAIRRFGITRVMVEAGGNIGLGDAPPGQSGWRIGVAPAEVGGKPREYLALANAAVSTSGDLWQYVVIGGVRYSHLIDPRTGMALTNHCSATVVGPSGLAADGLSSAAAILGPERGLKLIDNSSGVAGMIVRLVDGKQRIVTSQRWRK